MELKIGGVTLLRILNQWFRRVFVIFDISVYSGSIMISDVPFSTISMDLKGFDKIFGKF
jgi:AICAR transformylase/IMP cyclohydrolase PurH